MLRNDSPMEYSEDNSLYCCYIQTLHLLHLSVVTCCVITNITIIVLHLLWYNSSIFLSNKKTMKVVLSQAPVEFQEDPKVLKWLQPAWKQNLRLVRELQQIFDRNQCR